MTVICKFERCGYCENGFCANPTTAINESGMCSHLYKIKNGAVTQNIGAFDKIDDKYKVKAIIEEAEEIND